MLKIIFLTSLKKWRFINLLPILFLNIGIEGKVWADDFLSRVWRAKWQFKVDLDSRLAAHNLWWITGYRLWGHSVENMIHCPHGRLGRMCTSWILIDNTNRVCALQGLDQAWKNYNSNSKINDKIEKVFIVWN